MSSGLASSSIEFMADLMVKKRFLWLMTTPLGTPVDPLVYMMIAVSSGVGGRLSADAALFLPMLTTSQNGVMVTPSRKPEVSVDLIYK